MADDLIQDWERFKLTEEDLVIGGVVEDDTGNDSNEQIV